VPESDCNELQRILINVGHDSRLKPEDSMNPANHAANDSNIDPVFTAIK
jgi:hypothetical protein